MVKKKKGWSSQSRSFDKPSESPSSGSSFGSGGSYGAYGKTGSDASGQAKEDKKDYGLGLGSKSDSQGDASRSPHMSFGMSSPAKDSPLGNAAASALSGGDSKGDESPTGTTAEKAEDKTEAKAEDKTEAKAEDKTEAKAEDKIEAKAEDKTKAEGDVVLDPNERTTTIGPTIIIRGKLKSDENLIVRGRIEAEITSSKDLHLETTGIVNADMRIKSVTISGIVVGDIHAEERVKLAPEARVVGDIYTPRLVVEDGASFRGRLEMDGLEHLEGVRPQAQDQAQESVAATDAEGMPAEHVDGESSGIMDADAANTNDDNLDHGDTAEIFVDENVG